MIIQRWRREGVSPNFGDELNTYIWPKVLSSSFNLVPGNFYGIGSILTDPMPEAPRHTIFGAGYGYTDIPTPDPTWRSWFVRGPRTSAALKIPYITDPGILVRLFHESARPSASTAFMPRWDSMSPELVESCTRAGFRVIDPSLPPVEVIPAIQSASLLLTEALHGAVVADALRVPWISIYATRGHEFKWLDWCGSLDMVWNPIDMETFTLTWAAQYAVPQLSAPSISDARFAGVCDQLARLNAYCEEYTP